MQKLHSHIRKTITATNDAYSELAQMIDDCSSHTSLKQYLDKTYAYLLEGYETNTIQEKHLTAVLQELQLLLETFQGSLNRGPAVIRSKRGQISIFP